MTSKRKTILIICIVIFACILISAIAIAFMKRHEYELSLQIDDINGDTKAPAQITDEMVNNYFEDYRAIMRRVTSKKENTSGVVGRYEDCDRSYIQTKIKMLSGIYVSHAYLGKGADVTYTISSSVKSGNFRIVITDDDCNILYDIPIDQEYTLTFFAEKDQHYYVKFIAESAEIKVVIKRTG